MRLSTLRGEELAQLTTLSSDTIRSAMQRMNTTGRTLLIVNDDHGFFVGVVSDGDIRRYLAAGASPADSVSKAANSSPVAMPDTTSMFEIRSFMERRGFEYVPLIADGRATALSVIEYAPRSDELSAVVMVGGLGSRLAPLTNECPKPLLPVGGKPILSHIIEHLRSNGIHRYTFTLNYLAHMIIDHYEDGSRWNSTIDYVHETQRLGTGGSLSLVDPDTLSDPFVCLNGDVLTDIDVIAMRDLHDQRGWEATMAVREFTNTIQYGVVDTGDDGHFRELREKPVQNLLINSGIYVLSKSVLELIPNGEFYDLPTLFAELADRGRPVGTYRHPGRWIDIGTTAEYERARAIFEEGTE